MKNLFKNSIVALWLVAVLVSSTGFSLHTTYCFCVNQSETSLFETTHACKKQHEDATVTTAATAHLHPCCKRALAEKKARACAEKQSGCTKTTIKFVKADLKCLGFKTADLPEIEFILVSNKPFITVFSPKRSLNYVFLSKIIDREPPQYSGRQLLNFIQVYRI